MGFFKGAAAGFFGGLNRQAAEAKTDNIRRRDMLFTHIKDTVIPQYNKTKLEATKAAKVVDALKGPMWNMDHEVAVAALADVGVGKPLGDYIDRAKEMGYRTAPSVNKMFSDIGIGQGPDIAEEAPEQITGDAPISAPLPSTPTAPSPSITAAPSIGGTTASAPQTTTSEKIEGVLFGKQTSSQIHGQVMNDLSLLYPGVEKSDIHKWVSGANIPSGPLFGMDPGAGVISNKLSDGDTKLVDSIYKGMIDDATSSDMQTEITAAYKGAQSSGNMSDFFNNLPDGMVDKSGNKLTQSQFTVQTIQAITRRNHQDNLASGMPEDEAKFLATQEAYVLLKGINVTGVALSEIDPLAWLKDKDVTKTAKEWAKEVWAQPRGSRAEWVTKNITDEKMQDDVFAEMKKK